MFQRHVVAESLLSLMSNELSLSDPNKRKIIVGNWKMNGSEALLKDFSTFGPAKANDIITVSYTHLTLPTKRIV